MEFTPETSSDRNFEYCFVMLLSALSNQRSCSHPAPALFAAALTTASVDRRLSIYSEIISGGSLACVQARLPPSAVSAKSSLEEVGAGEAGIPDCAKAPTGTAKNARQNTRMLASVWDFIDSFYDADHLPDTCGEGAHIRSKLLEIARKMLIVFVFHFFAFDLGICLMLSSSGLAAFVSDLVFALGRPLIQERQLVVDARIREHILSRVLQSIHAKCPLERRLKCVRSLPSILFGLVLSCLQIEDRRCLSADDNTDMHHRR